MTLKPLNVKYLVERNDRNLDVVWTRVWRPSPDNKWDG